MNEIRRKIVMAAPLVPVAGLTACGGGSDNASAGDTSQGAAGNRAQAMAVSTVGGLGLTVTAVSTSSGLDTVFTKASNLKVILPDATPTCQSCLNGTSLYVTLSEEISGYRRAIILKLSSPALNKAYTVSSLVSGDAMVVVNDGNNSNAHYEYILNSGTIKLTAYDPSTNKATMSFSNVQGSPTSINTAYNNTATHTLRLDGAVATVFRQETAAWMV